MIGQAWPGIVGSVDDVAAAVRAEQLLMLEHHPHPQQHYVRLLRVLVLGRRNWKTRFEPRALRIIDAHHEPRAYIAFDDGGNIEWAQGGGQVIRVDDVGPNPAIMWLSVQQWLQDMPAKSK